MKNLIALSGEWLKQCRRHSVRVYSDLSQGRAGGDDVVVKVSDLMRVSKAAGDSL